MLQPALGICGSGIIDGDEVCDGTDLDDETGEAIDGAGFVHITGNFAIEKGPTAELDVATRWKTEFREILEGLYATSATDALNRLTSEIGVTFDGVYEDKADADSDFGINETFTIRAEPLFAMWLNSGLSCFLCRYRFG